MFNPPSSGIPVSTAKLLVDFYNYRRSAVNHYQCFAYAFVFLMLLQYYWPCDSYSANRRSAAKKKSAKTSYWRYELALLAYKRRMPRCANNISCNCYIAPSWLALRHSYRFTCYSELTYNLGSTDRKRKYDKTNMNIKQNEKIMPSAAVPGQYPTIDIIFYPP
jgi:hypothetical protein